MRLCSRCSRAQRPRPELLRVLGQGVEALDAFVWFLYSVYIYIYSYLSLYIYIHIHMCVCGPSEKM